MKHKRKLVIAILLFVCLIGIVLPISSATAASSILAPQNHLLETDPWYAKPILWILDKILEVFGGIHDPGDHVFYQSCFKDEAGCGNKVFGLYTEDTYNHVIRRGFALFSIAMGFIVTIAIVKSGVLYSMTLLSSTLKLEVNETLIKCMVGIVLVGNFFTVSGSLFNANNMIVSLVYQDIKKPIDLSAYGPNLNGDMTSRVPEGERIKLRDFATEQSGLGKLIVAFATRGVAIWWEIFYLQRFLFISLLLVLAPLWIAMMFYPMLQGITMAAFKELWSQIVAQAVHAGLFWLFFNLFDKNMGWFHVTVAMALFIPLSESVRFIFGATSQTGSKLAMIGTAAGMGTFLHMGKAIGDVKDGFKTVKNSGSENNGGSDKKGNSSTADHGGSNKSENQFVSNMRLGGNVAATFSKGGTRFAGAAMGIGLGPAAQNELAEAGATVGNEVGYRVGAGAVAAKTGIQKWMANAKDHYENDKSNSPQAGLDPRYQSSDPLTKAVVNKAPEVASMFSAAVKGLKGNSEEMNDPAALRSNAQKVYGAVGEVIAGRGGYALGDAFAQWKYAGTPLSAESFTPDQPVFTVETRDGTFLAKEDNGQYTRISNFKNGNMSLAKGQVVVRQYVASKENGQPFSIKPIMQPSDSQPGMIEEIPPVTFDSEGNSMVYQGRSVNPNDFLEKGRPSNNVDLRRRTLQIPSLNNVTRSSSKA